MPLQLSSETWLLCNSSLKKCLVWMLLPLIPIIKVGVRWKSKRLKPDVPAWNCGFLISNSTKLPLQRLLCHVRWHIPDLNKSKVQLWFGGTALGALFQMAKIRSSTLLATPDWLDISTLLGLRNSNQTKAVATLQQSAKGSRTRRLCHPSYLPQNHPVWYGKDY